MNYDLVNEMLHCTQKKKNFFCSYICLLLYQNQLSLWVCYHVSIKELFKCVGCYQGSNHNSFRLRVWYPISYSIQYFFLV
ncbi:hypothetical protein VIGAN_04265900 [Vigna angularis var. angularis]|uniref:Uncharacterized protein n=1 Tax=Vigna angularis var. angularis TaxID=157739 RepID=A0A0S3RX32_PHAAN|nr:hypothetical protein VIGAN_04265900 [Vigna angularis var. angularis]